MNIAGIDIGTTGCKCTVYREDGQLITEAYREYNACVTKKFHTIDAEMVWKKVCEVLNEVTNTVSEIVAICVTSFGEASIMIDSKGEPLAPAMLFSDPNGEEECQELIDKFGESYIYERTRLLPGKMYSASKWLWMKKHRPNVMDKCKYICLFEDFIVYRLSGIRQIDYSLAARTMAFQVDDLCWDQKILALCSVKEEQLSRLVPSGTIAGPMLVELSDQFRLKKPPIIVSGCHDQIAAAIGSGVLKPGQAVDGTGTVECMTCVFDKETPVKKEELKEGGYAVVPFLKDSYVAYAFSYTGGALLKWYRNNIANEEAKKYCIKGESPYEMFNHSIDKKNPSPLLILPYFAGAGTPYMNHDATGVIYGLTLSTKKEEIYQGLMEGVTYEMKLNLDLLEKAGIKVEQLYATGGGANSKEWLQIKADILNRNIVSLGAAQSGTLGCIMLASVACGCFHTLEESAKVFIHYQGEFKPEKTRKEAYDQNYKKYRELYPRLYGGNV